MRIYHAIGLMSGSSLDGLDIAYCRFEFDNQQVINWELLAAETVAYSPMWVERLRHLPAQSGLILHKTNVYFAEYMSELLLDFMGRKQIGQRLDFISSHGHTVFHDPQKGHSLQIGSGAVLAAACRQTVISDFRQQDISAGGQGAPLAPMVDKLLWSGYDFCLNIGGIANVSANLGGKQLGFDVVYANQILNKLANSLGLEYDPEGQIASTGQVNPELLQTLQGLDFFRKKYPKSMSNEQLQSWFFPIFADESLPIADLLATACEHIGYEIGKALAKIIQIEKSQQPNYKLLVSGGGAFNQHLLGRIRHYLPQGVDLELPDADTVRFKEAVLMALLGLLRLENLPTNLPSVTGASRPISTGAVYKG